MSPHPKPWNPSILDPCVGRFTRKRQGPKHSFGDFTTTVRAPGISMPRSDPHLAGLAGADSWTGTGMGTTSTPSNPRTSSKASAGPGVLSQDTKSSSSLFSVFWHVNENNPFDMSGPSTTARHPLKLCKTFLPAFKTSCPPLALQQIVDPLDLKEGQRVQVGFEGSPPLLSCTWTNALVAELRTVCSQWDCTFSSLATCFTFALTVTYVFFPSEAEAFLSFWLASPVSFEDMICSCLATPVLQRTT